MQRYALELAVQPGMSTGEGIARWDSERELATELGLQQYRYCTEFRPTATYALGDIILSDARAAVAKKELSIRIDSK